MKRILIFWLILLILPIRAYAADYTAPPLNGPGEKYIPDTPESFSEGIMSILEDGIALIRPAILDAMKVCISILAVVLLLSMTGKLSDHANKTAGLVGTLIISTILLSTSNSYIMLASDTVRQLSDYGKLLVPVLTGALAAQGGASTSTALYTGTAVFDAVLCSAICTILIPLVYIWLILCIANSATGESLLGKLRDFIKWLMTWSLKILLYVFTGYMGITKVISGSADAAALKATKLTISGMVPVVGGILSDASESILVSAGIVKNSVGVYGLLAIAAIWLEPFVTIGTQYLLLKATAAICGVFGDAREVGLVKSFSAAMGFLLAMTGAVCLMLLVSIICFMKGVS